MVRLRKYALWEKYTGRTDLGLQLPQIKREPRLSVFEISLSVFKHHGGTCNETESTWKIRCALLSQITKLHGDVRVPCNRHG